jgi:hypothetical protein
MFGHFAPLGLQLISLFPFLDIIAIFGLKIAANTEVIRVYPLFLSILEPIFAAILRRFLKIRLVLGCI